MFSTAILALLTQDQSDGPMSHPGSLFCLISGLLWTRDKSCRKIFSQVSFSSGGNILGTHLAENLLIRRTSDKMNWTDPKLIPTLLAKC